MVAVRYTTVILSVFVIMLIFLSRKYRGCRKAADVCGQLLFIAYGTVNCLVVRLKGE